MIIFQGSLSSSADDMLSMMHEIVFETQFICVLSGKIVSKFRWGGEEAGNFGQDCVYTNANLASKVNI